MMSNQVGKVHFITYAHGKNRKNNIPYEVTQKLMVDSIQMNTTRQVVFHTHNLSSMKQQSWYHLIENFPTVKLTNSDWIRRDGYFCAYKVLFAYDLLDKINENDYIYYVDSSAYFREPFTENMDRFFDYVDYNGHVCGSHGNDYTHNSFGCLNREDVWEKIWPRSNKFFPMLLNHKHILASWYCFKNTEENRKFIREWAHLTTHETIENRPLISLHHTVDQSLFNVLVYKYGYRTFYNNTNHENNKNHNNVHRFINNLSIKDISDLDTHFPKPLEYCTT